MYRARIARTQETPSQGASALNPEKLELGAVSGLLGDARERDRLGDRAAAEAIYRRVLNSFPNHPMALGRLGTLLMRTASPDETLRLFDLALASDPTLHWVHNNRGCILEQLGQSAQSMASFRRAALLRPDVAGPAGNLRTLLARTGRLVTGTAQPRPGHPRLLAVTVAPDWWSIARMASQLAASGFDVSVLCPEQSFLAKTAFACERHLLDEADMEGALENAVAAWNPDLIVPGDEFTVHLLHHMNRPDVPQSLRDLIARSCGDPRCFGVVTDKARTLEEAASLDIPHPAQAPASELESFASIHGFPVMVKLGVGMGGLAVRLCHDMGSAAAAISLLRSTILPPYLPLPSLMVQKHVDGHPASIAFTAWKGRLLGGIVYRPLTTARNLGPSAVLERMDHPGIRLVAERLVERFGFSGFGGFDFMIESGTGIAYLLEMNPRVTLATPLAQAFGLDLAGTLHAAMTGNALPSASAGHPVVVSFPHEWWRDPHSPHLRQHFTDAPWDDQALISHALSKPLRET